MGILLWGSALAVICHQEVWLYTKMNDGDNISWSPDCCSLSACSHHEMKVTLVCTLLRSVCLALALCMQSLINMTAK